MNYFVYILESINFGRIYIGSTSDLILRIKDHNSGGTKSTKPYRPWMLIYSEVYQTKTEATRREWYLKHPKGYMEKKKIVELHKKVK
jgi:putative endonuclease